MRRPEPDVLRAGECLDASSFARIRQRAILEGCKWDPQVGDVSTLAPFPVIIRRRDWDQLAEWSENLGCETTAAELEILEKPELLDELGFPGSLRGVLRESGPLTPGALRIMRFDFHLTTAGWRISEVNSDVPGGFTEASFFTRLVGEQDPSLRPAGLPAVEWADAVARIASEGRGGGAMAMLAAPGYMEDQQIMAFLARELQSRGCRAVLANPTQLTWHDGVARLATPWHSGPVDILVRFYQGEWISRLPRRTGWRHFFRDGRTPVINPGLAVISESKRFPLVWDRLNTRLDHWRALLPETRPPHAAAWNTDEQWIVKSAMSNTGDDVGIRELLSARDWLRLRWEVRLQPGRWLAQRRFESTPFETPLGPMHACVGVYVLEGRACGAYLRLARRPLIDYAAIDAALLVEEESGEAGS